MKPIAMISRTLPALAAILAIAGCTAPSPNLDRGFGLSLNELKAQQVIDPVPRQEEGPQLDGVAAREAITRYQKSFAAPTPHQNVFTIGVNTAGQ